MSWTVKRYSALVADVFRYFSVRKRLPKQAFVMGEETYHYRVARYNDSWRNERVAEMGIAIKFWEKHHGGRLLEIGNVLQHYGCTGHTVVDKYEKAKGVLNEDILHYAPDAGFDSILSVSTFEHVGLDEGEDAEKAVAALHHTGTLLNSGGIMLVTIPVGANLPLQNEFAPESSFFSRTYYLRRISMQNKWEQCVWDGASSLGYSSTYPWANAICVGIREQT